MRRLALLVWLFAAAGCATAPPVVTVPTAPQHPDFVYPDVPAGTPPALRDRLDRGWRLLQANDFPAAEREFAAVLRANQDFGPGRTAQGYLELARRRPAEAVPHFDAAIAGTTAYPPALVGRGLALLEDGRDDEALRSFETALAANPSLPELSRRVDLLRVRQLQDRVGRAQRAAAAGQWDEAGAAYRAAIVASPDSAFLYRDLASVERRAGRADAALEFARQAAALDADDAAVHVMVAELLTERADYEGALAAYGRATAIDPAPSVVAAAARVRELARLAALPPQYHAIPASPAATRADLAALLGVRLGAVLARAPQRQVVVTDVRGNWAQTWIEAAARAGAVEVFSNYTFQPGARLRRGDLADVVSRVLGLMAAGAPTAVREWDAAEVAATDVPVGHLAYPAVRRAVAAGVMPLDSGAFRLLQPVTGAELVDVVTRLASQEAARR